MFRLRTFSKNEAKTDLWLKMHIRDKFEKEYILWPIK